MKSRKRKAIFAGSFDPITNGHLDIICRASKLFDELIKSCTKHLKNIKIVSFDGLLVNYCQDHGIDTLIRGVRTGADIEYELQMAHMNRELNPNIETIILPTKTEYSFISSSLIKEVLTFGGDVKNLVPETVLDELQRKANGGNEKCM